jgi:hypothetical protein
MTTLLGVFCTRTCTCSWRGILNGWSGERGTGMIDATPTPSVLTGCEAP